MDSPVGRAGADSTRVVLGPPFLARLERFVARARTFDGRDEGRRGLAPGRGVELEGHRPYREGEDLRDLDWEMLARLGRAWVRVRRAERGERLALVLDTSASMGLGAPSKLEHACELATALALATVVQGGSAELLAYGTAGTVERFELRARRDLPHWLEFLRHRIARGERPLREILGHPRLSRASRVVVLGDLMDLTPVEVLVHARRGCRASAVAVLARRELAPKHAEGVEWFDPERGDALELELNTRALDLYGQVLEERLGAWRNAFTRRGQVYRVTRSDAEFEVLAAELLA